MTSEPVRSGTTPAPSPWIVRYAHLVPAGARVLDLACGFGRHARLFAQRGAHVLAVDRDRDALATLDGVAGIETRQMDLEASDGRSPANASTRSSSRNYLHRPTLPQLIAAVADDGTLLYETFARGNEAYGRPSNPDFLLEPGELLAIAAPRLTVVAFAQGRRRRRAPCRRPAARRGRPAATMAAGARRRRGRSGRLTCRRQSPRWVE